MHGPGGRNKFQSFLSGEFMQDLNDARFCNLYHKIIFMRFYQFLLLAGLFITSRSIGQSIKDANIPKPTGFVNDFEKIYTPGEITILDSLIAGFEKRTTIQIAIITIDTTMMKKEDLDAWTLSVMNAWGVGQKDKKNGMLIGISRGYRIMRIQNGYGIEKNLSDLETKKLIDNDFIPFFKEAKYFEGTMNGLKAIMKKLN